jgi:hypothetical protein
MRARPNLGGSIQFRGQNLNYAPSPGQNIDPNRAGSGGTITMGGVTRSYAPTPARAPLAVPGAAPSAAAMQFLQDGRDPDVAAPAPAAPQYNTYSPRAVAQRPRSPLYNPPQQTERANPLSGANNFPMEGQSQAIARPPFVQRGAGVPAGQDAAPQTLSQDADVGTSMQGTFDRLRGTAPRLLRPSSFSRNFGSPKTQSVYDSYLSRVLGN